MPEADRRRAEWRLVDRARVEMESRLGPAPSFEATQLAESILRFRFAIAVLGRKRATQGGLSHVEAELQVRLENGLQRALKRFERIAPATKQEAPTLREHLAARYGSAVPPATAETVA